MRICFKSVSIMLVIAWAFVGCSKSLTGIIEGSEEQHVMYQE